MRRLRSIAPFAVYKAPRRARDRSFNLNSIRINRIRLESNSIAQRGLRQPRLANGLKDSGLVPLPALGAPGDLACHTKHHHTVCTQRPQTSVRCAPGRAGRRVQTTDAQLIANGVGRGVGARGKHRGRGRAKETPNDAFAAAPGSGTEKRPGYMARNLNKYRIENKTNPYDP